MKGVVKWFNDSKGFGFITPDDGGEDLFIHFSEIKGPGFKTLKEGQSVEFEKVVGKKGKEQASDVKPVPRIIQEQSGGGEENMTEEEEKEENKTEQGGGEDEEEEEGSLEAEENKTEQEEEEEEVEG